MERYQTVYAIAPGAVAAPTAGLHFSNDILEKLAKKGVILEQITLHVGAGTFKPIEESVDAHTIERENFSISTNTADTINKAIKDGRRIIAVGTTSLRALESAAQGRHLQSVENSWTNLYVKPGHDFKIVDGLVTNFHLSRSSLLVLVSGLCRTRRHYESVRRSSRATLSLLQLRRCHANYLARVGSAPQSYDQLSEPISRSEDSGA